MASLILAAGFMTYAKVKDKREAKKEKKRKAYETRYEDLQREHSQHQEKHLQTQRTGDSQPRVERDPFTDGVDKERRSKNNHLGAALKQQSSSISVGPEYAAPLKNNGIQQPDNFYEHPPTIISIHLSDPEHPNNWPKRKKYLVLCGGILNVINSTLGSSLPSSAIPHIAQTFHVTNELQLVLPISTYLVGYVVGPTVWGPLSEHVGRKPVMTYCFVVFAAFTMGCALASNWPMFLIFRWLCGVFASGPIAVVGGLFADINGNPRDRGAAMAWFMAATTCGPCIAPFLSGFIAQNTTWRWVFWTALILAGLTFPIVLTMPETYLPVLQSRRAAKMRKESGNQNIIAKSEIGTKSFRYVMTVVMVRPYRMLATEAIVFFTCIYLSLVYGVFYLTFQAWPLIYEGLYGMTPGIAGLAFLPIAIGSILSSAIFLWYDSFLEKARQRNVPWAQNEEYRRLPLACVGGLLWAVSLFWVGWSADRRVPWIVPMLSGVTLGMGFLLIFMVCSVSPTNLTVVRLTIPKSMLNYLSDTYLTFAASAQGIASTCRSSFGVLLPLSAGRMYATLGIHWACTLLGFLSLGMAIIPFAFIRYGDRIRASSKLGQEIRMLREKEETEEAEFTASESTEDIAEKT